MPASSPEQSRAQHEAIAALALKPLRAIWSLWNPAAMDSSLPIVRGAVGAVVNHYGAASSALSLQHHKAARADAGVTSPLDIPRVGEIPEGFIDQALTEALAEAESDIQKAIADLDAKAERLILNQGRKQALNAVNADRFAKGWARVPNPGACSFCLMLAVRSGNGLLYSATRAFSASNARFRGAGAFKVHDNCRCTLEPVFGQYEPPADVREAMRVWDESTKGRTGHDARVAFRQAVEGRTVTGSTGKGTKSTPKAPTGPAKTPETQRFQLDLLLNLPPAKTPEAAAWRRNRIAEIRKYLGE